jgi:hypothetical protein
MSVRESLTEGLGAKLDEEETARQSATLPLFDLLTQVSADAKYIVRNLVLWFLVLPLLLGVVLWGITR